MTAPITPPRLQVGVISAGRVGTALGEALAAAGHPVIAVHARSAASRERAARRLPSASLADIPTVTARSDLLVLAVPDTELAGVAQTVAATVRPGQIVLHTAGAHGVSVLEPVTRAGALPLAVHPAMTFVGSGEDTVRLASSCFGITSADEVGDAVAAALVLELGGTPVRIAEDRRTLYHAALAHGANNLIALITDAVTALEAAIDTTATVDAAPASSAPAGLAAELLAPLARASLENVLAMGPSALTGPVARGDAAAVAGHLEALAALPDPGIVGGYRTLAARAAAQSGAPGAVTDVLEVSA
ncbi:Rossmann-like and DUF2520 domain-containing protein [Gordonia sp. VNK21]|uniref:Rossmann-like and DUF2520 domain-containing protein n=1 Tax=Gordonia sp. VNK21 TaxID=3382483 RepID=UPI0038D4D9C5